ncbi:MAG TPA: ComEC/Rec2 family competence protein, partial [Candidatus Saccharimonadales bacterium]|nr:ComEC/Rec2 family competence protein [Candidatus Saccharimonadales bacterium]
MNFWFLKRPVHISWQIALLAGGIVVGVIASQTTGWFASVVWLFVGSGLAAVGMWRGKIYALPFLLCGGIILGLWRGGIVQVNLAPYANIEGATVEILGTVSDDPEVDKHGMLALHVAAKKVNEHSLEGKLWVSTHEKRDIKRSDEVVIKGKIEPGFGSFAASIFRAEIIEVRRPVPGDIMMQVRDSFAEAIRRVIPDPEASLGIGYLLGQRRALPPELDDALKIVGLTHIVVASGYNLTILVRFTRRLFARISKYLAMLAAGGTTIGFVLMTGFSPSMSRAGLVTGLSLLAWYYGRKFHPIILLSFVAALTLLINPTFGWNDLGWQLSFLAFAGVMIVAPLLHAYFFGDKKPGTIRQIMGETIAAQIMTFPILVAAFGVFSNIAVVANLLVLPFVPLAMLLVFCSGLAVILAPPLAPFMAALAQFVLGYMVGVVQHLANLPWAQAAFTLSPFAV